jgi:CheY-like chemotaxis protein
MPQDIRAFEPCVDPKHFTYYYNLSCTNLLVAMASKNYRILIVDDLADNSFMLKTLLESEGYTIDIADSGPSAWEKLQALPPDLVLLDVMMPELNGYELTRRIRRDDQLHSTPVVLITAYVEACRIKGLAAGANDFIRKPIDIGELFSRIETLLQHKSSPHSY